MSFTRLKGGDSVTRLSARALNNAMAAGEVFAASQSNVSASGRASGIPVPDVILLSNWSSIDIDQFAVLGIAPTFNPVDSPAEFMGQVHMNGTDFTVSSSGAVAVALEPIRRFAAGRAQIGGVCAVKVNIQADTDNWAKPAPGIFSLISDPDAGFPILWKETGLGERMAIVHLGPYRVPDMPTGSEYMVKQLRKVGGVLREIYDFTRMT